MVFKRRKQKVVKLSLQQAEELKPKAVKTISRDTTDNGGERIQIVFYPRGVQKIMRRKSSVRTIELEAVGVEVLNMCDGKTSVRAISQHFSKVYHVNSHEAELAVATFIRMMNQRGLVTLATNLI